MAGSQKKPSFDFTPPPFKLPPTTATSASKVPSATSSSTSTVTTAKSFGMKYESKSLFGSADKVSTTSKPNMSTTGAESASAPKNFSFLFDKGADASKKTEKTATVNNLFSQPLFGAKKSEPAPRASENGGTSAPKESPAAGDQKKPLFNLPVGNEKQAAANPPSFFAKTTASEKPSSQPKTNTTAAKLATLSAQKAADLFKLPGPTPKPPTQAKAPAAPSNTPANAFSLPKAPSNTSLGLGFKTPQQAAPKPQPKSIVTLAQETEHRKRPSFEMLKPTQGQEIPGANKKPRIPETAQSKSPSPGPMISPVTKVSSSPRQPSQGGGEYSFGGGLPSSPAPLSSLSPLPRASPTEKRGQDNPTLNLDEERKKLDEMAKASDIASIEAESSDLQNMLLSMLHSSEEMEYQVEQCTARVHQLMASVVMINNSVLLLTDPVLSAKVESLKAKYLPSSSSSSSPNHHAAAAAAAHDDKTSA